MTSAVLKISRLLLSWLYGDYLLDYLHLPKSTLAEKTITKNIFELAEISKANKRMLTKDVNRITWEYRIAPDNSNIRAVCNDTIDYSEIQVIRIDLKQKVHITRISDLILSSFQYPLLLVFCESSESLFVAAHVRINQNDKSRLVIEDVIRTDWIPNSQIPEETLDMSKMRSTNLFDLYSDVYDALSKIKAESHSNFSKVLTPDDYKTINTTVADFDEKIAALRAQLKKEDQFNRQVELNNRIKELQKSKEEFLQDFNE